MVHVNEGKDGTGEWLHEQGISYSHTSINIGICKALNLMASHATRDYFLYLNDDMFVLPGWDTFLIRAIEQAQTDKFMISSTCIALCVRQ